MSQYGCGKCGSTGSVLEMRRVVVTIGADKELQAAGIVPVQRCLNGQCNAMSTVTNLEIGKLAGLAPIPQQPQAQPGDAEVDELALKQQKMADLLVMKKKIDQLESELVEPPEGAPCVTPDSTGVFPPEISESEGPVEVPPEEGEEPDS